MTDLTSWTELGVDEAHPAYQAARRAFELGVDMRAPRDQRDLPQADPAE